MGGGCPSAGSLAQGDKEGEVTWEDHSEEKEVKTKKIWILRGYIWCQKFRRSFSNYFGLANSKFRV